MESDVSFVRVNLADQVAKNLRETVEKGGFLKVSGFPSSRQLAYKYGVSHNVMLKALRQLYEQGILNLDSRRKGYELC